MHSLNSIDRSKFFAELGTTFRSHSAPFVTIVRTSAAGDEISAFCAEFSRKTDNTVYLEGEADSVHPFMVPYRPFFYAIYCSRPDYDNFREIDYNRVEKLAFALGISSEAEKPKFSIFETMKSFYGFKHEAKDSPTRMKIFQEIANVFSYMARRGDIVFHIKNADKIDPDTAELINFICRNLKEHKILIILSHNEGSPIPEEMKKVFNDFIFGHYDFPCEAQTTSTADIFVGLSSEAVSALKVSSIFYNDFSISDMAACLEKTDKEVLPALAELTEKGFISESSYRGIFRYCLPRIKSDILKTLPANDFKKYNAAILSRFSKNIIGIPDIGLSRLVYHALNIEDYATVSAIASRLAISLCEVGCPNNALKLIKFMEYIIFHKKNENISASLRSEIYIIHGQIYIILGKYEKAFEFFTKLHGRLAPLFKDNANELKRFDIQINKWLGLIALLKPSLPSLKENVPLKYFTTAMALDVSSSRNRIECNNLIALYNYQIGDLEKASIFYRDNVKMLSMEKDNASLWLEADSTMRGLSSVCLRQGEFRKALAYIKKCEDGCAKSGNKKPLANTYHYMGMIYHNRGDFLEAVNYYEHGIAVLEEISDKMGQSRIWTSLGVTFFNQAKYREALSYFNKSLDVAVRSSNKKAIAILNGNSARI
ncbi:MAG TPA: tetratricopeptide repeat protein, partial [Candidatus Wallbacteria bacterium]|nr:tetratricopeptide repeat protein [Candidatus Wallbacteria bacterium]